MIGHVSGQIGIVSNPGRVLRWISLMRQTDLRVWSRTLMPAGSSTAPFLTEHQQKAGVFRRFLRGHESVPERPGGTACF